MGSRGEGLTLFVVYMFPIIKKGLNWLIIRDMVNESIKIRRKKYNRISGKNEYLIKHEIYFFTSWKARQICEKQRVI